MANVSYLIVIPARYQSTRFPGKPLADLGGSPLIEHVWRRCCEAVDPERIIVATDDDRIREVAQAFGARVEMTSPDCLTGTDRVAEVAGRHDADWYINVQGDEPFIDPNTIIELQDSIACVAAEVVAINAMCSIKSETEFRSPTVPKVVVDQTTRLLYVSRSAIPTNKNLEYQSGYRQVGIYAFRKSALLWYHSKSSKSPLESLEDIEILRLVEAGLHVQMLTVEASGLAIDIPDDLNRARAILPTFIESKDQSRKG